MNADFVCIKVDREERPDLDAVYMNATVALTGQGGWPMTCFLTPDGRPFFCGTYYPKPSFLQLLAAVAGHVAHPARRGRGGLRPDRRRAAVDGVRSARRRVRRWQPALCDDAVAAVLRDEDIVQRRIRGGAEVPAVGAAGGAAAQPRTHRRRGAAGDGASAPRTAMARGGIYDQLAGGFARYSVDARLGGAALREDALRQRPAAAGLRALGASHRRPVGAQDHWRDGTVHDRRAAASTGCSPRRWTPMPHGEEGLTYVWTPDQLREVLGDDDGRWAAELFGVTERRHVRARQLGAAAARRPRRQRPVRAGAGWRCWRRGRSAAARPRRQGRHRVERAGDHRAGRGRRGA